MANSYPNYDPMMDVAPESAIPDGEAPMMMANPVLERASGRGRGRRSPRAGAGPSSGGRTGLYAGAAVAIVLIGAGAFLVANRMHQQNALVAAPAVSTGQAPAAAAAPTPAETAPAPVTTAPTTTAEAAPPSSAPGVSHRAQLARNERAVARHETRVARARAAADTGSDVSASAPMTSRSNVAPPPSGPVTMPSPIASQAASQASAPSTAPVVTPPPPQ